MPIITSGDIMTSRLRLKGRNLLIGNTLVMTMFFAVGVMLIMCINMLIMCYETYLRENIITLTAGALSAVDIGVSSAVLSASASVWFLIRLGADRFFFRLAEADGGRASDIFYYFNPAKAFEALTFGLRLGFIRLPFLILAVAPSSACFVLLKVLSDEGVSSLVALSLTVGGVLLLVNGIIFYRRFNALLFLCDYIFISGKYISLSQLLSASATVMKKKSRKLFRLKRSFIGWFMLCLFVFPIGYVWNYYRQTLAVAAAKFLED